MLINVLESKSIPAKKWIINGFQYNATVPLLKVIHANKRYRKLWLDTYHRSVLSFIFNSYFAFKRRFKCALAVFGLYPLRKDRIS